MEAAAADGRQVVCGRFRYNNESDKVSTNGNAPICPLPLSIVLFADARFTESMQTCERLRARIDVVTDLTDQKLVINLFHQFLASRHGGTLCLERLRAPRLRQSSGRTGYNRTQHTGYQLNWGKVATGDAQPLEVACPASRSRPTMPSGLSCSLKLLPLDVRFY